jgi:hypothetical protein
VIVTVRPVDAIRDKNGRKTDSFGQTRATALSNPSPEGDSTSVHLALNSELATNKGTERQRERAKRIECRNRNSFKEFFRNETNQNIVRRAAYGRGIGVVRDVMQGLLDEHALHLRRTRDFTGANSVNREQLPCDDDP